MDCGEKLKCGTSPNCWRRRIDNSKHGSGEIMRAVRTLILFLVSSVAVTGCGNRVHQEVCADTDTKQESVGSRVILSKDGNTYEVVESSQYNGVIFPKEANGGGLPSAKAKRFWTPSRDDVIHAEGSLKRYLKSNIHSHKEEDENAVEIPGNLCRYNRQYVGIVRDGRKIIHANLFRDETIQNTDFDSWTRAVVVYGGGINFFQLDYDVDSGDWDHLYINSRR